MHIISCHYLPVLYYLCRCNLAGVMLQLLALGVPDVFNFDFMSKPSPGKRHVVFVYAELLAPFMTLKRM